MKCTLIVGIALSLLQPVVCLYSRSGDVQILNSKNFLPTLRESDKITIVEFFAPWCGHCKNLAPVYKKVAASLKGFVNVAAIDCDEETNKRICSQYDVKGFPTIKMMRPRVNNQGKRDFSIEDYNGERTVKAMTQYATSIMPSKVHKITSQTYEKFLSSNNETVKVMLFTKKGSTSSTYKALSTTFPNGVIFGQIRDNQAAVVETFGVQEFPKMVLLPGRNQLAVTYNGEMKFNEMKQFISSYVDLSTTEAPESKGAKTENPADQVEKKAGDQSCPMKKQADEKNYTHAKAADPITTKSALVVLTSVENLIAECVEKGANSALLAPVGLFKSIGIVSQSDDPHITYFEYDSVTGQQLKAQLNLPNDRVIFVNGKKRWYIAANTQLSNGEEVREFLDNVKQGSAGKKVKFEVPDRREEL